MGRLFQKCHYVVNLYNIQMKACIVFNWILKVVKAFNLLLLVTEGVVGNFLREVIISNNPTKGDGRDYSRG